jgi:hypothetical protein
MAFPAPADRDSLTRAALYRTRVLVNRTPHFTTRARREANRGLDLLDAQLGLNQVNLPEAVRGVELLIRATPSLAFGLLRDDAFVDRFGAALRHLGLRGIGQRLDGHALGDGRADPDHRWRRHRDELPAEAHRRRGTRSPGGF